MNWFFLLSLSFGVQAYQEQVGFKWIMINFFLLLALSFSLLPSFPWLPFWAIIEIKSICFFNYSHCWPSQWFFSSFFSSRLTSIFLCMHDICRSLSLSLILLRLINLFQSKTHNLLYLEIFSLVILTWYIQIKVSDVDLCYAKWDVKAYLMWVKSLSNLKELF